MFSYFTNLCSKDRVKFDPPNQQVRYLRYIINLVIQLILKNLKTEELTKEDILLEDNENKNVISLRIVRKVNYS
jgi:hypothetical protein